MTSPSHELQVAIVARLETDAGVSALVAGRVYDDVPPENERIEDTGAAWPYVSMGPSDELSDDADCIDGFEISFQIDCWSRAVGFPEVRKVADAVRRALHDEDLPLAENAMVSFRHRITRVMRDPDGKTSHAALSFTAVVEQP
ncbi:DUF3168 domain-containing protein [Shinella daejeonensis]|uniref:DUF3168 domain-containing protein n=1 Tax=Shinella daejeonensis TaxID=659017 RepID=UPI0020C74C68|nr:DUF3168 domain-containing protein [Shinella daejeonensis]MCP8894297.1 DUF3168 domain-containing protein [Shinella daejeonensis]